MPPEPYDELDLKVREGTLLAAGPDMLDPNFMHRVVLVCRHADDGAYGLVVNRVSEISTREVFATHPILGSEDTRACPIFIGGPVGLDTVQVLHRVPDKIGGGVEVAPSIHVGGDLEDVAGYISAAPEACEQHLMLVLGYAGWGGGQLEAELAEGAWLPAVAQPELVFSGGGDGAWRRTVRSIGGSGAGLAEQPPDPGWN